MTSGITITSVHAAALRDPTIIGRGRGEPASWHDGIDHMNPLGAEPRYAGQASRFQPMWPDVLCIVTASDGSWGLGMTTHAGPVVPFINDHLAPMLIGDDALDTERLWQMMTTTVRAHIGLGGISSHAISAVDLALWDLAGKVEGRPVHALLGAEAPTPMDCYATSLDVTAAADMGFGAFKLPCPWGPDRNASIGAVVDLLGAVRAGHGDCPLMLDCWAVLDVDGMAAVAEAVAPLDLVWLEDGVTPDDWQGYATLRAIAPDATLAAGERWFGVAPFAQQASAGTVDVLQPDALWVGGASAVVHIAEMASRFDVQLALHCSANDSYGQHLAAALTPDGWGEMYLGSDTSGGLMSAYRSTPGMSIPRDGRVLVSDAPGFGIELTLDQIELAT